MLSKRDTLLCGHAGPLYLLTAPAHSIPLTLPLGCLWCFLLNHTPGLSVPGKVNTWDT